MGSHPSDSPDLLAREGDPRAMGALLERHRGRLLERVRLMMGPSARRLAESADFVQGAFTDALAELDRLDNRDEQRMSGWSLRSRRTCPSFESRRARTPGVDPVTMTRLSGG